MIRQLAFLGAETELPPFLAEEKLLPGIIAPLLACAELEVDLTTIPEAVAFFFGVLFFEGLCFDLAIVLFFCPVIKIFNI